MLSFTNYLLRKLPRGGFSRGLAGWVLLLCLAAVAPAAAAPKPVHGSSASAKAQPLPPDLTTVLPARQPNADRLRDLAQQRDFRYVEPEASSDAWDAFWAWLWRPIRRFFSSSIGNLPWRYVLYAVALGILVFAVLKLLQVDITAAFGRSARRRQLAYDTATENIHEVNFAARIAEAEEAGNYRLATRLGYLEVLKHLTDRGLIQWQPDKTNHAYLAELTTGSLREAFRGATRQFEYVWYGDLRLNASLYQQARVGQRAVTALLASQRPAAPVPTSFPSTLPA